MRKIELARAEVCAVTIGDTPNSDKHAEEQEADGIERNAHLADSIAKDEEIPDA
jgi:hypothetical protein